MAATNWATRTRKRRRRRKRKRMIPSCCSVGLVGSPYVLICGQWNWMSMSPRHVHPHQPRPFFSAVSNASFVM